MNAVAIEQNVPNEAHALATDDDTWYMRQSFTLLTTAVFALALFTSACSGEVLSLDVGTCFDDPPTFAEVSDVHEVECSEPHDNEVIGLHQLSDGDYPGEDGVATAADAACVEIFEDYLGIAYAESIYDFGWLVPTADSWGGGDREVICFAYDVEFAKITGSVRNIQQ